VAQPTSSTALPDGTLRRMSSWAPYRCVFLRYRDDSKRAYALDGWPD
jgi:hypothetical protein